MILNMEAHIVNFVLAHMNDLVFEVISDGNLDILEFLISKGVNLNSYKNHTSLLRHALESNQLEMFKLLVRSGANLDTKETTTPLHICCERGHLKMVNFILEHMLPCDLNIKDSVKRTPLHVAVEKNHEEIAMVLINNGAHGEDLLSLAVYNNNVALTKLLLDHQANLELKWCRRSPLQWAIENNNLAIADLLLKYGAKWDPDIIFECKSSKMMAVLIKHGVSLKYYDSPWANTVLHKAVTKNDIEMIEYLSTTELLNMVNGFGETPLWIAVREQNLQAIHILINAGADCDIKTQSGFTARRWAHQIGNSEIINLIEYSNLVKVPDTE